MSKNISALIFLFFSVIKSALGQIIVPVQIPKPFSEAKLVISEQRIMTLSLNNVRGIFQRIPEEMAIKPILPNLSSQLPQASPYGPFFPGTQFLYIGSGVVTFRVKYDGSALEKLLGREDIISFKIWSEQKPREGKVRSYCCMSPSLDGTREFVHLFIEQTTNSSTQPARFTGVFERKKITPVGVFDKGVIFEQIAPLRSAWNGILFGPRVLADTLGRIVYADWETMGSGLATDDRYLVRYDPFKNTSTVLIRKTHLFSGERVDWWQLFTDFQNNEPFVWYLTASGQKIVRFADDQPLQILSTNQEIGSWGKPLGIPYITANRYLGLIGARYKPKTAQPGPYDSPLAYDWPDAIAFWDGDKVTPLIREGELLPGGKTAIRLSRAISLVASVSGCEADFMTLVGDYQSFVDNQTLLGWYRVLMACIQKAPVKVFAGQDLVLEGKNFAPSGLPGNPLTEVLIDNLAVHSSQVIHVSDTKATLKAPVALGNHSVQIRVSYGGRTSVSKVVDFSVLAPPPPPPTPVTVTAVTSLTGEVKPNFAPGEIITVWGKNMANSAKAWDGATLPLPTKLGCQVLVDVSPLSFVPQVPISLYYCSDAQINGVLPVDLAPGKHKLIVVRLTNSDSAEASSAPVEITVSPVSPTFLGNSAYPIFLQNISQDPSGNIFVSHDNPATIGDVIIMYATGLGDTEPPIPKGMAAAAKVLARIEILVQEYAMELIGVSASPQYPGLYQIAFRIKEGPRPDENGSASLEVRINGQQVKVFSVSLY